MSEGPPSRRRPRRRFARISAGIAAGAALALLITPSQPANAAPAPSPKAVELQAAEKARLAAQQAQAAARAQAARNAAEEKRLSDARIATAARLRVMEQALSDATDRVTDLARKRADTQAEIERRAALLAPLLPVIERLQQYPAETLLAMPQTADESVRGLLVLGGITRQLADDVAALRTEQDQLSQLGLALEAARQRLVSRQYSQAREAAVLDRQLDAARLQRHAAEDDADQWTRRAAEAAAKATSLRQAIDRIEAERQAEADREAEQARAAEAARAKANPAKGAANPAPPTPAPHPAAQPGAVPGTLLVPVAGAVVRNFGDVVDGVSATGLVYRVPPGARVVAPCSAHVVYAGLFRSYGLLTILDCGGGYHAVLSGFDRLDVRLGQSVQQGEPIGAMPSWNPLALQKPPTLSMEVRRDGQPINPTPYLKAS